MYQKAVSADNSLSSAAEINIWSNENMGLLLASRYVSFERTP